MKFKELSITYIYATFFLQTGHSFFNFSHSSAQPLHMECVHGNITACSYKPIQIAHLKPSPNLFKGVFIALKNKACGSSPHVVAIVLLYCLLNSQTNLFTRKKAPWFRGRRSPARARKFIQIFVRWGLTSHHREKYKKNNRSSQANT
jgi:hypothetical protein